MCLLLWLCFRFHVDFVKGGDVVFHFNPRFHEQTVVRNSQLGGYWGPEERDGMFPFIQGRQFEVRPESDTSRIPQMFEFVLIQHLLTLCNCKYINLCIRMSYSMDFCRLLRRISSHQCISYSKLLLFIIQYVVCDYHTGYQCTAQNIRITTTKR